MKRIFFLGLISLFLFVACDNTRVYEQNIDIAKGGWKIDSVATFNFSIDDSTAKYNIYYNVRNTLNYPYYNLYVTYYLEDTTGNLLSSNLHEMILMDSKTGEPFGGKPLGSGLGDIFSHQFLALSDFKFPHSGKYIMKVKQYMRQDPLPEILTIGIRVEKAENK